MGKKTLSCIKITATTVFPFEFDSKKCPRDSHAAQEIGNEFKHDPVSSYLGNY
jgi:hypothetical protein